MAFDEDLSAFFDIDGFAVAAVYTPLVGEPINVVVLDTTHVDIFPSDFESKVHEQQTQVWLKKADIPHPRRGDTIYIVDEDKTYTVDAVVGNDAVVVKVVVR